jgi:2-methylcitrate dehydratase PrpD
MDRLSTYMGNAYDHPLPENVEEAAKQHILDTLAAMMSGSQLPQGQAGIRFAREYGGPAISTVVASPILCGPIEAALANGMLAHSDETEDSHAPSQSHPGCAVVEAALAAGEKFGIDTPRFLRAVSLGYDVGPRVTMALGGVNFQTETHRSTHNIAAVFGTAAAAGSAARLTTASRCGGCWITRPSRPPASRHGSATPTT